MSDRRQEGLLRGMSKSAFARTFFTFLAAAPVGATSIAAAQEAPQRVGRLGGDPYARSWAAFCEPQSLQEAADLAIQGGMRPEARSAFIAALEAECRKSTHETFDLGRNTDGALAPRTLSFMLWREDNGTAHVMGRGSQDVVLDTTALRNATPVEQNVPAVLIRFTYQAGGRTYEDSVAIPLNCFNAAGMSSRDITAPVAVPVPPPPAPLAEVRQGPPVQWFWQNAFVSSDCCRLVVVDGMLAAEYRGTVEAAQGYFRQSLRPREGGQTLLPERYQENARERFAYLVVVDPQTRDETFWCMDVVTGQFSRPQIVTGGGRGEPQRREEVRTRRQFEALMSGTLELDADRDFSLTGDRRGEAVSVMHIQEPIPLAVVDRNDDGIGDRLVPHFDRNNNGVFDAGEGNRTRRETLETQMSLIGRHVFPVSADAGANERADRVWGQIMAAGIPEGFINATSTSARVNALRAAFPELSESEARRLGSWLHYYGEIDMSSEAGVQTRGSFGTEGRRPTFGTFLNGGIRTEIDRGVQPHVQQ